MHASFVLVSYTYWWCASSYMYMYVCMCIPVYDVLDVLDVFDVFDVLGCRGGVRSFFFLFNCTAVLFISGRNSDDCGHSSSIHAQ